jgi:probable HAF family extracellular repeat protein
VSSFYPSSAYAYGMNELGDAVGQFSEYDFDNHRSVFHAIAWIGGTVIELPQGGWRVVVPYDINDRGDIVGVAQNAITNGLHAVLVRNGSMIDLNTVISDPGWSLAEAMFINNDGQIAGWGHPNGKLHAFLLEDSTIIDLGTLGGDSSKPTALNERGEVIGTAQGAEGQMRAFLCRNGEMEDLQFFVGSGDVIDLNESGEVIGAAHVSGGRSFRLWKHGRTISLDPLIQTAPGEKILELHGINNAGQIVAVGYRLKNGVAEGHTFLLDLYGCADYDGNGNRDNDGDGLCETGRPRASTPTATASSISSCTTSTGTARSIRPNGPIRITRTCTSRSTGWPSMPRVRARSGAWSRPSTILPSRTPTRSPESACTSWSTRRPLRTMTWCRP